MPSTPSHYYRLRATRPNTLRPIARTARFVYLNRHCFNGVYRINRQGQFNVPIGRRTGAIPTADDFSTCARALRRADLRSGDFESCLCDVRKGDFVYLDPPYASKTRTTYGEYSYDSFEQEDLPRLLKALLRIDRLGATFLLSYAYSSPMRQALSRWHVRRVAVQRHVAGFARHRHGVYEILVSNRAIA
jgi:DNA adenine methylase